MPSFEHLVEEYLKNLPKKHLSWWADFRIKRMLRKKTHELETQPMTWFPWKPLVAVPVALLLFLSATGVYAMYNPSNVSGDFLYPVKTIVEEYFYPEEGIPEDRIAYHLWLSERRFAEAEKILERQEDEPLSLIPQVFAHEGEEADLLEETLSRAQKNMELAFLVTQEIEEPERLKVVHEKIQISVQRQKNIATRVAAQKRKTPAFEKMIAHHEAMETNLKTAIDQSVRSGHVVRVDFPQITLGQEPEEHDRVIAKAARIHERIEKKQREKTIASLPPSVIIPAEPFQKKEAVIGLREDLSTIPHKDAESVQREDIRKAKPVTSRLGREDGSVPSGRDIGEADSMSEDEADDATLSEPESEATSADASMSASTPEEIPLEPEKGPKKEKDECEKKAEEICKDSEEENCEQKEIKECRKEQNPDKNKTNGSKP